MRRPHASRATEWDFINCAPMGDSMKHKVSIYTLALLGALALAALSGGLLTTSDNVVYAADPDFVSGAGTRSVPENTPPGVNIGDPISATDADEDDKEFGNTLTYSLEGTDAASFDIDPSTGQLITKAALDFENPHGGTGNGINTYLVTVKVEDGESRDTDVMQRVDITVTDVDEPPAAPAPPTVVSGEGDASTTSLKVIWHAPENTGDDIDDYDVQYKKITDTKFVNVTRNGTDTVATITGLKADTSYQVRVRAKSNESRNSKGEEIAPWSLVGTGSTNKSGNGEPSFDERGDGNGELLTRSVDENEPAGEDVDHEVRANAHVDDNTLIYELGGPDADLFTIDGNGQIKQRASLNHEDPRCYDATNPSDTKCYYYVTVAVFDGAGGSDARGVTIEVDDRSEAPDAPARPTVQPTVRGTQKDSRSLDVSWSEPNNPGPPITGYDIRYRKGSSGGYTSITNVERTSVTIPPENVDERLTPGASYEVHVKAKTVERDSAWSALATGRTSARNREPVFDDRPDQEAAKADRTIERAVDENTQPGQPVGTALRARNPGGGLTYKLVAVNPDDLDSQAVADRFDINKSTGQILTKDPLNHEDMDCGYGESNDPTTCTYMVKVEVRDGLDEHGNEEADDADPAVTLDDEITVQINVRDVVETPAAPKVTVTSPAVAEGTTAATLVVTWNKPANTGPPITGYVVECTGPGITTAKTCPQPTISDLNDEKLEYTIDTLVTVNSSYRVRVRAMNDEGVGTWSSYETQSTSEAGNAVPTIVDPGTLEVSEAARSGSNVGANPVTASETDNTNQLSYGIEGPNDDLFTVDSIGQIKTSKALNHEDPRCNDASNGSNTQCEYTVRLKVWDRDNGSHYIVVTIRVTDEPEPPSAPATPTVTATADTGRSLEVTWSEPVNTGPPITGYYIAYRKYRQGTNNDNFAILSPMSTATKATIMTIGDPPVLLEPRTQYEVRVRAKNGEGTIATEETEAWGDWSPFGRGTTGASNERPVFSNSSSLVTLEMAENTPAGQNIGSAVEATDADRNSLAYSLEGPGAVSFDINRSTGQIRTKSGVTYDYESRQSYSVTVKVDDGQGKDNSVATKSVTIELLDRKEPPHTPAAPSVMAIPGSTDSVRVMWDEPDNDGPPITDYDVKCENCPNPNDDLSHDGADRSMIITGLTPGTRYEVQVRARNAEGHSDWSRSGTGTPNADVTNQVPIFSGGARTIQVAENTVVAGDPIGSPVSAVDPDLDTVTHTLEGTDATSFTIDAGSGQIRATAALDHEQKSSYSVTVRATDTRGGSATVGVTITVTDVDGEAPATPAAPTVAAASGTSLAVSWDAPENTGPPITDYDYRYRETSRSWTEVTNTTITATMVTIPRLTASTSYDVAVRATNAEGTSGWSNSGFGTTNAPGANNPPVFREGASATRSVSANAAANSPIGLPVTATDSDPGTTLNYTLEGADAASFRINASSGQLLTVAGVTLDRSSYTVTVVASDGIAEARITVTVTISVVTNNPPTFSASSASRSVAENTPTGQNVGIPVSATDANADDALTYRLSGANASSFDIVSTTGQIQTKAALDYETDFRYSVTVTVSDGELTDSITVTITVTDMHPGCATAIGNGVSTGLANDCEALLDSKDALQGTTGSLNWATFTPIANWDGIYVNGSSKRVTRLVLRRMPQLNGTIPGALGRLSRLENLSLYANNGLTGPIPAELGKLSSLRLMYINNNNLSGTIPAELGNLNNLERLWLHRNSLSGSIPTKLGDLSSLQSLSVYGNDLSGSIPTELGRLSNLTVLYLHANELTGLIPTQLGDLTNLQLMYLWGNDLTGAIPTQLGGLSNLRVLSLGRNRLTGAIPTELGNLSNLERLYVYGDKTRSLSLDGGIPTQLGNLTKLTTLVLQYAGLTGAIPSELGDMTDLEWLNLQNNQLSGSIPTELGGLSNLERLYLHYNRLSDEIPSELGSLSELTNLWLKSNQLSGDIPSELGNLQNLERVRISQNPDLTGCVPAALTDSGGANSDAEYLNLPTCQ